MTTKEVTSNKMLFKITLLLIVVYLNVCFCEFVETPDKIYFASKEVLNWTDAKNACAEAGLELVSILNKNELLILEIFLKEYQLKPADKWSGYWLAGIRYPNGTFFWDTTSTEVGKDIKAWLPGEPSNAYQKEHCVELKFDKVRLGWNDYFCVEERKYLCQASRKEVPRGEDLDDYSFLAEKNANGSKSSLDDHLKFSEFLNNYFLHNRKKTPHV
ncbi:hypothetical protein GWI33_022571 [Rhynchophorus ferrugineus]|uniref:C-type lectin domain-containing protein n=1 Tax=Rhynchophorus ferrugineus TaxID=354439 RepID=A0A834J0C3_RHYFE|nr:hypothetical protein GWI33_022571 [Rhynchophorus ferrugineus]